MNAMEPRQQPLMFKDDPDFADMAEKADKQLTTLLRSIVEDIESIDESIAPLMEDRKELFAQAKGNGLDMKALRQLLKDRKRDREEVETDQQILDLYRSTLL